MKPNTPHIVLTTRSCIAEGTHFYNFDHSSDTFAAMVAEHFAGAAITNAEYPKASLLYFKAIGGIADDFQIIYGNDASTTLPVTWNGKCYMIRQDTLWLYVLMIVHSAIARHGLIAVDDVHCIMPAEAPAGNAG